METMLIGNGVTLIMEEIAKVGLLRASVLVGWRNSKGPSKVIRVPQKTMLEPTVNEDDEKMQSITSSEKEGDDARVHADNNDHHVDSF